MMKISLKMRFYQSYQPMNLKINLSIQDNGNQAKDMVKAYNIGQMAQCMKAIGEIVIINNIKNYLFISLYNKNFIFYFLFFLLNLSS